MTPVGEKSLHDDMISLAVYVSSLGPKRCRRTTTSVIGTSRHAETVVRCPLIGVDRKWLAEVQTGAFDREQTSATCFPKARPDLLKHASFEPI
jgi:hypothetical protein